MAIDVARWYTPDVRRTPAAIETSYGDLAVRLVRARLSLPRTRPSRRYSDAVNNAEGHGGSASIAIPDYWWYVARADLLEAALRSHVEGAGLALDLGSADGPSAAWFRESAQRTVSLDIDPRGLGVRRRVRLGAGPAVRATPPSTRCRPSTSSSTASPRPPHSPRCAGCCGPAAGSSCRCPPTPGPGATSTSPTATTGGTRPAGPSPRSRRRLHACSGRPTASRPSSRCSRWSGWPARCHAVGPTARSTSSRSPSCPRPSTAC